MLRKAGFFYFAFENFSFVCLAFCCIFVIEKGSVLEAPNLLDYLTRHRVKKAPTFKLVPLTIFSRNV